MRLVRLVRADSLYAEVLSGDGLGAQLLDSHRSQRRADQLVERDPAAAGALPTLDFSAGYDGALSDSRTRPRAGETSSENGAYDQTVSAGLDLEWTIFEGFRIRTDYRRLQELKAQGELETRIAIEDFVASLAAEYYNFVQQKIRLKNFRYAVSLSKERLRIVEARYRIGSFSRLDLLQARVDFNADSSQYITQQELVFASRIRLNELMAVDSVDRHILVLDSLIRVDETLDRRELERQMLRANASLLRSAREQTLAELDLQTLRSRNYPYLKLGAGYGYSLNRYGQRFDASAPHAGSRCRPDARHDDFRR